MCPFDPCHTFDPDVEALHSAISNSDVNPFALVVTEKLLKTPITCEVINLALEAERMGPHVTLHLKHPDVAPKIDLRMIMREVFHIIQYVSHDYFRVDPVYNCKFKDHYPLEWAYMDVIYSRITEVQTSTPFTSCDTKYANCRNYNDYCRFCVIEDIHMEVSPSHLYVLTLTAHDNWVNAQYWEELGPVLLEHLSCMHTTFVYGGPTTTDDDFVKGILQAYDDAWMDTDECIAAVYEEQDMHNEIGRFYGLDEMCSSPTGTLRTKRRQVCASPASKRVKF